MCKNTQKYFRVLKPKNNESDKREYLASTDLTWICITLLRWKKAKQKLLLSEAELVPDFAQPHAKISI